MTLQIKPWQQGQSIYDYVKTNIDAEGFFAEEALPDHPVASTGQLTSPELGAADAFLSNSGDINNTPFSASVEEAVKAYSQEATEANALKLYMAVSTAPCIFYHEDLIDTIETTPLAKPLEELVIEWLYHSPHREAVKFSIIMSGLYLLNENNLTKAYDLKKDLLLLAKCEEFTSYVTFALSLAHMLEKVDLWDILTHTSGWGKVGAVEDYDFSTPEEKDWLLCHGCQLSVSYPPLSIIVLKSGNMEEALKNPKLSHNMYSGILTTLSNYLMFLLGVDTESEDNLSDELPVINLYALLDKVLTYSKTLATNLEDMAGLIAITEIISAMAGNGRWQQLTANQCHLLMSKGEQLVFQSDWKDYIISHLFTKDEQLNPLAASIGTALSLDLRPHLMKQLKKHPEDTDLYYFLLQTEDEEKFQSTLAFAQSHLEEYKNSDNALKPILAALAHNPGEGKDFIVSGLTSIYDEIRAAALNTLENWDDPLLTPEIKLALLKAKAMCQHPFLGVRIDLILNKKALDLDNIEDIITKLK